MKPGNKVHYVRIAILVTFAMLLSTLPTRAQSSPQPPRGQGKSQDNTFYLPVVNFQTKLRTVFGVQMPVINDQHGLQQVLDAKSSWVRRSNLSWATVEQVEGEYDWGKSKNVELEEELIRASANGLEIILVIHRTPDWAQKIPGYPCGPVKPEKIPAFAKFINQAVSRYSVPPFNVKYWQIWNEPEADHAVVRPDTGFGCWGDPDDPYFGGGYFGEVLKEVYPQLKIANPNAKLVLGGLLLACSPDTSNCPSPSSLFFEGILDRNGAKDGGQYIDLVAFHAYDHYYGKLGQYGNPNWNSSWDREGPAIIAKAAYVRKVMNAYGIDLPIMVTESALLCGRSGQEEICLTDEFEETKAFYVAQLYGATLAEGLQTTIWYHVLGWRKSELLDDNLEPLPAYYAFKFAREELRNGSFVRRVTDYKGVAVYEFNRSDRRVWLMWSQEGEKNLKLPETPRVVWDVFGNSVERDDNDLIVGLKPLYVEWPSP